MKKLSLRKIIMILGVVFWGLSSSGWAVETLEVKLEEVVTIGTLEDDLLFQWAGVAVDEDGNIYVTDALDYTVKKFDQEGRLLHKAGRKGQGPGEFLAPRFIDCTQDWVYVTDQEKWGIQVFDKDLHFKRNIPLQFPVSDLKVIDDDQIALVTISYGTSGNIYIVDGQGETMHMVPYVEEASSFMMDMVDFVMDPEGVFYVVYSFQDKIEKISRLGKKVWSRHLLNVRKIKKKKFSSFDIPTEVVFKDVAIDSRGYVYILGGHHSKHRSRDVYILDQEGGLVATFVLPEPSHCLHIDGQDYLYSRANDGVTLKKYELIYRYDR
jgi:hypothetical protein